jgi:transcription elongation GreA/GreB family factor
VSRSTAERGALPDKHAVRDALCAQLEAELARAAESQQAVQAAVTHEESRAENDKDTRAIEASYLARGQARRVAELGEALARVSSMPLRDFGSDSPVALSAILELSDDERSVVYFIAPGGGGLEVRVQGATLKVLTPGSPLGRALLGRCEGDDFEVRTPQGLRHCELLRVS